MKIGIETVAVGLPRVVPWRGRDVRTSIFKSPVEGGVAVKRYNLEGDRQSDRAESPPRGGEIGAPVRAIGHGAFHRALPARALESSFSAKCRRQDGSSRAWVASRSTVSRSSRS